MVGDNNKLIDVFIIVQFLSNIRSEVLACASLAIFKQTSPIIKQISEIVYIRNKTLLMLA